MVKHKPTSFEEYHLLRCDAVKFGRRLAAARGTYCLHLQDRMVSLLIPACTDYFLFRFKKFVIKEASEIHYGRRKPKKLFRMVNLLNAKFLKAKYIKHCLCFEWLNVFEKRVLRTIFGTNGDGIIRGLRKFHNEELHNLHSSPNISTMIKSRTMIWTWHLARMGRRRIQIGGKSRRKETTRKTQT
jgi:hypothetical protein